MTDREPVEILAKAVAPDTWNAEDSDFVTRDEARAMLRDSARDLIRPLEAAGYRICGPEPTEEMVMAAFGTQGQRYIDGGRIKEWWRDMLAAAPTYGKE
jgi:hypothetical protein